LQEEQLIDGLINRNDDAFRFLLDSFKDKVFNTCLSFVRNRHDAEDLTQEVFVEVHKSIGKFRREASLSTWIYKIAINKSLEYRRKQKRKKRFGHIMELTGFGKSAEADESVTFEHPGVELENKERGKILFKAMDELSENQRAALVLYEIEGLSYKEIAGVLETSLSSVESLIFRAKQNLRTKLRDIYEKQGI
jgi:RNA polymerase sigma factor (sigma-70 family)